MRLLCTFVGSLGHLAPLLPLARAAQAAGHDVAVAGSGGLVPRIQEAGFRAFAARSPTIPAGQRLTGRTMNSNTHDVPFHARHDDELLTLDDVAEILRIFIRMQRLASQPVLGKLNAV